MTTTSANARTNTSRCRHLTATVTAVAVALLVVASVHAGDEPWVAAWASPDLLDTDEGMYVCLDAALNVYVAGRTPDANGAYDYVVIKYDSDGVEQWAHTYDAGSGSLYGYDQPRGIGVDDAGNVYVTGMSRMERAGIFDYDFLTIKYNAAGVEQWIERFSTPDNDAHVHDEPTDLHVDGQGNVYITGNSLGAFLTVVYNSAGTEQWTARFNEPSSGGGVATAITVDGDGYVYITGYHQDENAYADFVTIKYTPLGGEMWASRFTSPNQHGHLPHDIAVDSSGNVIVTGSADYDAGHLELDVATVKYNSLGAEQWVKIYDGPGTGNASYDEGFAVAVDNAGNVFVTGHQEHPDTSSDYLTIKYSAGGVESWVETYNETLPPPGLAGSYDLAQAIGVDAAGNVYITGWCEVDNGVWTESQYVTIKYSNTGSRIWVRHHDGDSLPTDNRAFDLAVDGAGNVAVTGYSWTSTTGSNDVNTLFYPGNDDLFSDDFETGDTSRWSSSVGS